MRTRALPLLASLLLGCNIGAAPPILVGVDDAHEFGWRVLFVGGMWFQDLHTYDFRRTEMTPIDDMSVSNRQVTPSQILLRREVLARIRSMLSEEEAKAIDLMLENRDWNEIGEALGLKADTARMRVRRALDRVRQDIGIGAEDFG